MITRDELLKKFGVTEVDEKQGLLLDAVFDNTIEEYERSGVYYANREFILDIQKKYRPFTEYFDFVMERVESFSKREDFKLFSLLLHRMLEYSRDNGSEIFSMFKREKFSSVEDEVDFEFTGFFAELAFVHEMADYYFKRGLPKECFTDTIHDMYETAGIYAYSLSAGRLGYNNTTYFSWNQYYVYHKIVKIGELNFEIDHPFYDYVIALKNNKNGEYKLLAYNKGVLSNGMTEGSFGIEERDFFADFTETPDSYIGYEIDEEKERVTKNKVSLSKSEWSVAIRPGDNFLNVHIPRRGKINSENNEAAYREAIRLHRIMFPEKDLKAIVCTSWLLSPDLKELLSESSNIIAFQSKFHKYPIKATGKTVFSFAFPNAVEKYEDLAEDTSLQRKIKSRYLEGKSITEGSGIIFFDEIKQPF